MNELLKKKTTVVFSAYSELLCALHVLHRPDHHPYRVQWAKDLRGRLPASFLTELEELGELTDQFLALLDLANEGTLEQSLQRLGGLPDAEFLVLLYNQRHPLSQVLDWMSGRTQEWKKELDEPGQVALARPGWTRRRIVELLEEAHRLFFQDEWYRIEPWLVRAERTFLDKLAEDATQALNSLHPRLKVKDDALYAQKVTLYRLPWNEVRKVAVRPSTFVYPHLLFGWGGGIATVPLAVEVPNAVRNQEVPLDLVRMFKALSDPTRLSIVRSLFQQPHCTQQLAHIHGVSEAAVSKHLKLLAEAGYVTTERRGNYLFYALKPEEMEMLIVYLRQFLEQ